MKVLRNQNSLPMERINEINWEVFDLRKLAEDGDRQYFSFKDWEVDFLLLKIKELYPEYTEVNILRAILTMCKQTSAPHEKKAFLKQIISVLEKQ